MKICVAFVAVSGLTLSLLIHHHAQFTLRKNEEMLQSQIRRQTELETEHRRLSNQLAQVNRAEEEDHRAELMQLRAEAEKFRRLMDEKRKPPASNPGSRFAQPGFEPRFHKHSVGSVSVVSDSDSEEYAKHLERLVIDSGKKSDARNLGSAVRQYVREHQGEFPANFDLPAPYFYQDRKPPRTGDFELIFQGSSTELTNVPDQAVALIRERHPWPTPRGKWARIYVMAGGELQIVESDDNFQSWETEHIIPPPAPGP